MIDRGRKEKKKAWVSSQKEFKHSPNPSLQPFPLPIVIPPQIHVVLVLPFRRISRIQNMRHAAPPRRRRRVVPNREILVIAPVMRRVPRPAAKGVPSSAAVASAVGKRRRGRRRRSRVRLRGGLEGILREGVADPLVLDRRYPVWRGWPLGGGRA